MSEKAVPAGFHKVYIGVIPMAERTLELLRDCPIDRLPPAPLPKKWNDESGRMMGWVFGPVIRPDFVIDESLLPY